MTHLPTTNGGTASGHRASPSTLGKPTLNDNGLPNPAPVHLIAMRSAPLDLTSVERRGQPTTNRHSTKRIRPLGLQEAPTFKPTMEDFKDPFLYIEKIASEASQYGICKIIPPDSWMPDFAIDTVSPDIPHVHALWIRPDLRTALQVQNTQAKTKLGRRQ